MTPKTTAKYFYFVFTREPEQGKYYSYAERIHQSNNLLSFVRNDTKDMTAFDTFTKAKEVADFWNECYKNNGTYYFSRKEA